MFLIELKCPGVDTSDPNAVVVGLCPDKFNFENLNVAFK